MKFFLDYLHQKVPAPGKEIPLYYRRALVVSESLMAIYFAICCALFPLINGGRFEWVPLLFAACAGAGLYLVQRRGIRLNLTLFSLLCLGWVWWSVVMVGWDSGVQLFLIVLMIFLFFNIYEKPWYKIVWFVLLLSFRMLIFNHVRLHPAAMPMDSRGLLIYQILNSITILLILAGTCIIFSTSIQDTERMLRLRNQALHKEAGTDPLTGLPNRRAMIEKIEGFLGGNSNEPFCVAIADIDFFKHVNDTYGHNCGDYTLVKLTELFENQALGKYSACRWGGEEFCFFIPGKNLDEAGMLMNDLCIAVEHMKLEYEGNEFSITITIGVEEYDFASPLENLLEGADEKLYMGKNAGRNRVVV